MTSASDAASTSWVAKPSASAGRAGVVVADAGGHVEARVAQVQRPRAPLVAVADDGDALARQRPEVRVTVVVDRRHRLGSSPWMAARG